MSGHSKWHTIKHKKGAADAKRGKIFTRIIKELTVAARAGGGDPDMNPRLRTIIAEAKADNMPADNIKRAIRRGTGEEPGVSYEEAHVRGLRPGRRRGDHRRLTDNKNRTVGELRHMLDQARRQPRRDQQRRLDVRQEGLHRRREEQGRRREADGRRARRRRRRPARRRRQLGSAHVARSVPAVLEAVKALGIEPAAAEIAMLPQNYVKLEGKTGAADAQADGSARRPRRRPARLVELRHRGEGDRGLAGVRDLRDRSRLRAHRLRLRRDRRLAPPPRASAARSRRPRRATFPDKLLHIHRRARRAPRRAAGPTASRSRTLSTRRNARSALKLGHARGVAMLAAVEAGAAGRRVHAGGDQARVVGYGRAEKPQVQQMVKLLLGLDAVAVAARRRRRAGRRDLPRARAAPPARGAAATPRRRGRQAGDAAGATIGPARP